MNRKGHILEYHKCGTDKSISNTGRDGDPMKDFEQNIKLSKVYNFG